MAAPQGSEGVASISFFSFKLSEVTQNPFFQIPAQFLLQVPRFGGKFKTYNKIIPDLRLEISELTDTGIYRYILHIPPTIPDFVMQQNYKSACFAEKDQPRSALIALQSCLQLRLMDLCTCALFALIEHTKRRAGKITNVKMQWIQTH